MNPKSTVLIVSMTCLLGSSCKPSQSQALSHESKSSSGSTEQSENPSKEEAHRQEKFPPKLPAAMKEALKSEDSVMAGRIDLVRSLESPFSSEQLDACYQLMGSSPPSNVSVSQWRLLLNELMEVLRKKGEANERYAQELANLANRADLDPVLRDYALQHWFLSLETELQNLSDSSSNEDLFRDRFSSIEPILSDPASKQLTLLGTSLQAAVALAESDQSLKPLVAELLTPYLQELLDSSSQAIDSNRASSIQVVSRLGLIDFHSIVRGFIVDPDTNLSLQLSSVAALGLYREPADQALLEELVTSNPNLRYAAQAALKNF